VTTEDYSSAERLHQAVVGMLVMRVRNAKKLHRVGDTAYFNRLPGRGVEVAVYVGTSKVTGEPCCRVELRVYGSRCLKAAGVRGPRSLLDIEASSVFRRFVRLCQAPSVDVLGRAMLRRHLRASTPKEDLPGGTREASERRLGKTLCMHAQGTASALVSNDLLVFLRKHRNVLGRNSRRLFKDLSLDWVLPAPGTRAALLSPSEAHKECTKSQTATALVPLRRIGIQEDEAPSTRAHRLVPLRPLSARHLRHAHSP
jgi:hypothetical protein